MKYIYQKKLHHSFAIGVFSTIELLQQRPQDVMEVIISNRGRSNSGVVKIVKLCEKHRIKVTYNDNTVQRISKTDNNYAIGVFKKYETKLLQNENHILLINPSNMGNLGTIIRTSLAFNCNNLAIVKPAVDVFDPKVIRGSMGAIFHSNIEYFLSFNDYFKQHKTNRSLYMFEETAPQSLSDIGFKRPWTMVFGNEGEGFDHKIKEYGTAVRIPQDSKVDSLNLSVAVGIVLFKTLNTSNG